MNFNPRTPCGVRQNQKNRGGVWMDFNPRTPCGVRPQDGDDFKIFEHFNPRTPCGVRQNVSAKPKQAKTFQSTHPMRGATVPMGNKNKDGAISIHAPHAGCDLGTVAESKKQRRFQSTHPMRGATVGRRFFYVDVKKFQSTHPMRGATFEDEFGDYRYVISIHAPHAGCDAETERNGGRVLHFNPRTPCGVRRTLYSAINDAMVISIHAPHAGCDETGKKVIPVWHRFQSTHPMRGATRLKDGLNYGCLTFQSTHPMRGATLYLVSNRGSHRRHRADSLKNKLISSKQTNKRSKTAAFPRGSPAISSSPEVRGAPLSAQNNSTPSLSYFCSTPNCSIRFLQLFPR